MRDRADHGEWFNSRMFAMDTTSLRELRDKLQAASNTDQKVRLIVKSFYNDYLERVIKAEYGLKLVSGMRSGLLDTYVAYTGALRYMTNEGVYDWQAYLRDIDNLVSARLRDEGMRAAAAPAAAAMHLG